MQGAWYSQNMLPSMVHGQPFQEDSPYPPPGEALYRSVGLSPQNFHQYPGNV